MHSIPAYVYVLFCVLVYLGVRRCFPRTMRPERLLVFPLVFLALGAASLNRSFPGGDLSMDMLAVAALTMGAGLGWIQAARWRLQFHFTRRSMKVRVPGDPSLLVTLLLSFVIKFAQQYAMATHAAWGTTHTFQITLFAAWGALAGMPLGRAINVVLRSLDAKQREEGVPTFE
jgi:hypothetical protein